MNIPISISTCLSLKTDQNISGKLVKTCSRVSALFCLQDQTTITSVFNSRANFTDEQWCVLIHSKMRVSEPVYEGDKPVQAAHSRIV